MRSCLAVLVVAASLPVDGEAQTAVFRGSVYRDTLKHPLGGAEVALPELHERGVTSDSGTFVIRALPAGLWTVVIRRVGFQPVEDSVEIHSGRELARDFVMSQTVQVLDTVRASAAAASPYLSPAMRGFEERRALGIGHFIAAADLRKVDSRKLADILRSVPGTQLMSYKAYSFLASSRGMTSVPSAGRGRGSAPTVQHAIVADLRSPVACWIQIYLDGLRIFAPNQGADVPDLFQFEASQYEAIEFYSGPSSTPTQYASVGGVCGTLLLWSRER